MITIQHNTIFFHAILILVSAYHHTYDVDAFIVSDPMTTTPVQVKGRSSSVQLRMGILDSVLSRFQGEEEDSFVKLEDMVGNGDFGYGPGPAVLLHNIPNTITDEEVLTMLSETAPKASQKGISMARIIEGTTETSQLQEQLMSLSLKDALEKIVHDSSNAPPSPTTTETLPTTATTTTVEKVEEEEDDDPLYGECKTVVPVVIFSGLSHQEMMASYNTLGEEIYDQTTAATAGIGMHLACATAVPNAMKKPLSQVIFEISGDHLEAIQGQECLL
mmetsp:Transcript_40233/g.44918  ORF Transcript_40233/g.44918 Transcript_40233/m.44918 type:complete len:275 (-) Transcript_40233:242-1066(-)